MAAVNKAPPGQQLGGPQVGRPHAVHDGVRHCARGITVGKHFPARLVKARSGSYRRGEAWVAAHGRGGITTTAAPWWGTREPRALAGRSCRVVRRPWVLTRQRICCVGGTRPTGHSD